VVNATLRPLYRRERDLHTVTTSLITEATKVTSADAVAADTFATTLAMVTIVTSYYAYTNTPKCCAVQKSPFEWAQLCFLFRRSKARRRLA